MIIKLLRALFCLSILFMVVGCPGIQDNVEETVEEVEDEVDDAI